ncbi:MAG TPA: flagellin hook IN motif-containing protein [Gemmatimonadaceae bacterium]|nr:flagellin hook IN motif-containing protein [Gemmatimonadaceae bacterium]
MHLRPASAATGSAAARDALKQAAQGVVDALGTFNGAAPATGAATSRAFTIPVTSLSGILARRDGVGGAYSTFQTTQAVNTQTSTDRASSSPLGLDLTTAYSSLDSAALGLDVTSPTSASTLTSSASLALDTTSPAAASSLASSSPIGLDLASPDRASVLESSQPLLLDVTSPETASQLSSSALGLDLTSPDAPSELQSSSGVGLDVTSPERASTLDSSSSLGLDITSPEASSVLVSSGTLGLDVTTPQRVSAITSYAAVNTATTSYAPNVALGTSTSVATLSGVYTGVGTAATTSTLTVKVMAAATVGATASTVHFQILDGATKLLDYSGSIKAGDRVYLGDDIGLSISFSAGTLANGQTGTSAVSHSAPVIDTAAKFNDPDPNLRPRFDNAAQVTAGSFTINGTTIAVAANDTIASVISAIDNSAAGVSASFDATTKKLTLASNDPSEDSIYLGNDTSGFLAAMKLTSQSQEINTATTSYASNTLTFGSSTTVASLTGTYTGTDSFASATSLTVKFQSAVAGGLSGTPQTLKFSVLDQSGHSLFSFSGSYVAGQKISIGNDSGLSISFSAGTVSQNDTASTTVSKTIGTDVNANAAFNATGNAAPRWDPGYTVGAGAFTVNGVTINVAASDTITSVLHNINTSSAGVTATLANDKITIVNNSGSNPVVIGNDTSGFLAATKLTTSVTVIGNVRDDLQVLSKTTQFSRVTNGSFSINGAAISVDTDTDSVSSIVSRINASAAGVTATYDSGQDKIVLTTNGNSEDLITVSGDTSGFVTAAKLSTANTVKGNIRDDQQVLDKTTQFAAVVSGSFTINGATVAVDTSADTLSTLIAKINASAAGVAASFDSTANTLHLVGNTTSEDPIVVGGDTSGFLTAAKMDTANSVLGNIRDDEQVLAKMPQFAGVTSGSFTINGTAIAFDTTTDTISSILSRITSSSAGVAASYDAANDVVHLTTKYDTEDPIAVSDSTGLSSALHLSTNNAVPGHLSEDGVPLADLSQFSSVVDGAFVIDGRTISVATTDSVNDIVGRINSSGARATATFDTNTNKIVITTTYKTEDDVAIGGDTSGFLAAAGISSSNTVQGNLRDDQQVLAKTSQFGAVSTGSFTINGVAIAVDASSDSLASVITRINGAGAGVTAEYDTMSDRLRLTATLNGEQLVQVGADATGFLGAAYLDTSNTVRGHVAEDGVALQDVSVFASVVDGSFVVDGKTITVDAATDTIQTIVDKVNNSGARVTATYDPVTDGLRLDATYDSEDAVPIGGDTSGFLAAAHVDAANTVMGNIRDDLQVLAKTTQFGDVTSGSFTINGVSIGVDPANDSLTDVVSRINAAGAGVSAVFDAQANALELTTTGDSEDPIAVGNDTTGFLADAHLDAANTARGNLRDDEQVLAKTSQFASVTSGSFTVNGVAINVDANADSFSTVVSRLNAAGADVTAAFDANTNRLTLVRSTPGQDLIDVGNDTTGFLATTGLATANGAAGKLSDLAEVLARTPEFSGVTDGAFTLNGQQIAVSAATDSLQDVVNRITAANAGVTASYNALTDTLSFTPTIAGAPLSIVDDTSGLLSALHVAQGSAGTHVNPNAVFNGAELSAPMFDPGQSVHAGSFTVNGVQIAVANNDSMTSVLSRISSSRAGVTAHFDPTTQTVSLTAKVKSSSPITIGADTSGFVAAAKMDASPLSVVGIDPTSPSAVAVGLMSEYAKVHAGKLTVNGVDIAIDPSSTTVDGVVSALNQIGGVQATVDSDTGAVKINAAPGSPALKLSDSSGLLGALGIPDYALMPRVMGSAAPPAGPASNSSAAAVGVEQAVGNFDAMLERWAVSGSNARRMLGDVLSMIHASGARGIEFDASSLTPRLTVDANLLASSLDAGGSVTASQLHTGGAVAGVMGSLIDRFATVASTTATDTLASLVDAVHANFLTSGQSSQ